MKLFIKNGHISCLIPTLNFYNLTFCQTCYISKSTQVPIRTYNTKEA